MMITTQLQVVVKQVVVKQVVVKQVAVKQVAVVSTPTGDLSACPDPVVNSNGLVP